MAMWASAKPSSNCNALAASCLALSIAIALDPVAGKFAYVADTGCPDAFAGYISIYTINPTTGVLAPIGPQIPTHDEGARSVAIDPFGKFVYAVNWGESDTAGSISSYTINATALTQTGMINGECPGLCSLFGNR